ncbi:MAG: hypothetical protein QXZ25_06170 [Candidatus Bathyarchaeia archaeon]
MGTEKKAVHRPLDYGSSVLIILVASIGFAAVVYGANIIPFDIFNLPAWIFCPLGAYTLVYPLITRRDSFYYLVWGLVMFAIGVISASYNVISPFVVIGILLILIAVIGIIAYKRSKR